MAGYELLAAPGCGSVIVEGALALTGAAATVTIASPYEPGPGRDRLCRLNPLGQVPVLILPDGPDGPDGPGGEVMTESAAMILHLADRFPGSGLAPPADAPDRPRFLRWLVFLVGAVYPTFTFGDVPARYVTGEAAEAELRRRSDEARQMMYRQMEAAAGSPWFLGDRFSAIDLYLAALVNWRPRRDWFAAECPALAAIADRTAALPALAPIWDRNFG